MTVENTSNRDPLLHFAAMMSDGTTDYIMGMEAAGQRQLVHSDTLPTKGSDALVDLGFKLGDVVVGDEMFRHVTLPDGWSKQPTDHSMWSKVVDEHGRERVGVFYKAAFYDRKAHCSVATPISYAYQLVESGAEPVLDDTWATREAMAEAVRSLIAREDENIQLWTRHGKSNYQREAEADKAKAEELLRRVEAVPR